MVKYYQLENLGEGYPGMNSLSYYFHFYVHVKLFQSEKSFKKSSSPGFLIKEVSGPPAEGPVRTAALTQSPPFPVRNLTGAWLPRASRNPGAEARRRISGPQDLGS